MKKLKQMWLFRPFYEFYSNKCADCGTTLTEFRNVHDTCKKCDLI